MSGGLYLISNVMWLQECLHKCMSFQFIFGFQYIQVALQHPLFISLWSLLEFGSIPSVTYLKPWETLQCQQSSHWLRYDLPISAPGLFPEKWMWDLSQSSLPISIHLSFHLDLFSYWWLSRNSSILSCSSQILCVFFLISKLLFIFTQVCGFLEHRLVHNLESSLGAIWNWPWTWRTRREWRKQTDYSRSVGGGVNKPGNFGYHTTSGSLPSPARSWKAYVEALTEFSHVHGSDRFMVVLV